MNYVCAQINEANECLVWVQTMSIGSLSYEHAAKISAAVIGCWVLAYGVRIITRFLINR